MSSENGEGTGPSYDGASYADQVQEKLYLAAMSALDAATDDKLRAADRAALIEAACKATASAQAMGRDALYIDAEERRSNLLDQVGAAVPLFIAGLAKNAGIDLNGGPVVPLRAVPPPPPEGPSVPSPG